MISLWISVNRHADHSLHELFLISYELATERLKTSNGSLIIIS